MKQPFFSIVIPTKDRPILLEDLLASIFNQEFQNYEIILSDNSDDNLTQEMLLKFFMRLTIRLESTPPDKNAPSGTSDIICSFTASLISNSNFFE